MERFTRWLGDLSARRPWRPIGSWVGLTALLLVVASAVGGSFTDDFSAPGSQSANAQKLLKERFPAAAGGSGVVVFAAPKGQQLQSSRAAVNAALAKVRATQHVASVSDPFTAEHV